MKTEKSRSRRLSSFWSLRSAQRKTGLRLERLDRYVSLFTLPLALFSDSYRTSMAKVSFAGASVSGPSATHLPLLSHALYAPSLLSITSSAGRRRMRMLYTRTGLSLLRARYTAAFAYIFYLFD